MAEDWDFYVCRVEGALASMALDLGLAASAPDRTRPLMGFVRVHLRAPRPDGLSDSAEFDTLSDIEEALTPSVVAAVDGIFVGRCTLQCRRDFYFYFASRDGFDARVVEVMARWPDYRYEVIVGEEPEVGNLFEVAFSRPRRSSIDHESSCLRQLGKTRRHALESAGCHALGVLFLVGGRGSIRGGHRRGRISRGREDRPRCGETRFRNPIHEIRCPRA
jgi:hypothetical protein